MFSSHLVKSIPRPGRILRSGLFASVVLYTFALFVHDPSRAQGAPEARVVLPASEPTFAARSGAKFLQWAPSSRPVSLSITLPLQHVDQLNSFLQHLNDPSDPLYHHYLTGDQFDALYGPSTADYDQVKSWVVDQGLTITKEYSSRTILNVTGSVDSVERAFGVKIADLQVPGGAVVYSHDRTPQVPQHIGAIISGVLGLSNASLHRRNHLIYQPVGRNSVSDPLSLIPSAGTGPAGGLAPTDVKTAYSLSGKVFTLSGPATLSGQGQSVALYELDTYDPNDVTVYASQFGLGTPNVTNVNVDGFNSPPGFAQIEVVLDIDMVLALAPKTHVYVYQGQDMTSAVTDIYQQIADDYGTTHASVVSSSWGNDEATDASAIAPEAAAFAKMQAQGQTVFVAAGDFGAYENTVSLSVNDPASQPGVTGVGGTVLTTKSVGGPYDTETGWDVLPVTSPFGPIGGGGGISSVWPKQRLLRKKCESVVLP